MTIKNIYWGISALHHDAALCVITEEDGIFDMVYASHAERYSRLKNDIHIHPLQIQEALAWGEPTKVFWYENHWRKRLRWLKSGELTTALTEPNPTAYVRSLFKGTGLADTRIPVVYGDHHKSHLYSLLSTNPYEESSMDALIVDAVGEHQCSSLWFKGATGKEHLISEEIFPKSIGMLYAAVTNYVGLKPMEEEYIVMGMAAYGKVRDSCLKILCKVYEEGNLQRGFDLQTQADLKEYSNNEIAASVQQFVYMQTYIMLRRREVPNGPFGISGGVALNCVNNQRLADAYKSPLWVFPNAGDAGSCVGAVMQHFPNHKLRSWSPYSGTNLGELSNGDIDHILGNLINEKVCGVAHDKAEFGPRALGNRSILGDPRDIKVKERVNQYKNRQQFRPLAPMVLESAAWLYFDINPNIIEPARYMQITVNAKVRAQHELPAVVHFDNTARIQIVRDTDPVARILRQWEGATGCPVLMNTSLNIRGEPLVNTWNDAKRFEQTVKIPVITPTL